MDGSEPATLTETELAVFRSEIVALQAVMIGVFRRMVSDRPELASLFCSAFDDAETILSGVAMKMGLEVPASSTLGALKVIEEIRSAVIRDGRICR